MGLEAVVFDAEGVVIDTESIWDEGQRVFLARRGIEYDREHVKPMLTGRSLRDGTATLAALFGLGGEIDELARERAEIVRGLMADAGFIPGFTDFFAQVKDEYKTAIATAMAEDLFEIVDRNLGLREMFDGHVYTLGDVGRRSKPDPALFLYAATRLGAAPEHCLVIEDSPHGVEAGRRAGMFVVGLATTYETDTLAAADLVIEDYAELDLSQLLPGGTG